MAVRVTLLLLVLGCSSGVDESRVKALEADLAAANATVADLTTRLETIEAQNTASTIQALDERLTAAESTLSPLPGTTLSLGQQVAEIASGATTTGTRLDALEASSEEQSTALDTLSGIVDELAAAHEALASATHPAGIACPEGMTGTAGICIDAEPRPANSPDAAQLDCHNAAARVCSSAEWTTACYLLSFPDGLEMVGDYTGAGHELKVMTSDGIGCVGAAILTEPGHPYRCCIDKASLVYGSLPE